MTRIIEGTELPAGTRVAIIVSRYNDNVTERLLEGALRTAEKRGIAAGDVEVYRVPGAWELPLAASAVAHSRAYDAIVCLGAVIKGETTHDEHINRQVSDSLGQLSLRYSLPIGFGLLTVQSLEQAMNRAGGTVGNKGEEATEAALEMVGLLAHLPEVQG
ncbi:MAG: 6,7-dimethyl-8-ribityllumazine synthase [Pirellulaceae bacterium]|nr:6,7-dimethyl-8-ribityllumazine synthase [Planctomycetales bacterium]